MDDNKGWVAIHRKIFDHWLWDCRPFDYGHAWIDLLLLANHKDTKRLKGGKLKVYKRGTISRSKLFLSQRWGWERKKVTRFLKMLEDDGMVVVDSTTHGTTITIENYTFYQWFQDESGQPMEQPMDITKTQQSNIVDKSELINGSKIGTPMGQPQPLKNEGVSGIDGQPMEQPMDNHYPNRWTTDGQPLPTNNNDNNENNDNKATSVKLNNPLFVDDSLSVDNTVSVDSTVSINDTVTDNGLRYLYSDNSSNNIQGPNLDSAAAAVIKELDDCGFQINQHMAQQFLSMLDEYGETWVTEAIQRASDANVKSTRYVAGILRNWQEKGGMDERDAKRNNRKPTSAEKTFLDLLYEEEGLIK